MVTAYCNSIMARALCHITKVYCIMGSTYGKITVMQFFARTVSKPIILDKEQHELINSEQFLHLKRKIHHIRLIFIQTSRQLY